MVVSIMGLYSRLIFPRLCDWSMRNPRIARFRREVLAEARGEILEIIPESSTSIKNERSVLGTSPLNHPWESLGRSFLSFGFIPG